MHSTIRKQVEYEAKYGLFEIAGGVTFAIAMMVFFISNGEPNGNFGNVLVLLTTVPKLSIVLNHLQKLGQRMRLRLPKSPFNAIFVSINPIYYL